jgi:urea transport system permease protein
MARTGEFFEMIQTRQASKGWRWIVTALFAMWMAAAAAGALAPGEKEIRETVAQAMVTLDTDEQSALIRGLAVRPAPLTLDLLARWKEGGFYIHDTPEGERVPVVLNDDADADGAQSAVRLADLEPLKDADGQPLRLQASELELAETDSNLRRAMKDVADMAALTNPDPRRRRQAAQDIGLEQNLDKLEVLKTARASEGDRHVVRALDEAIALVQLRSDAPDERRAGCDTLGRLGSIPAQDALKSVLAEATAAGDEGLAQAANDALARIGRHVKAVNTVGTLFRGLSAGSILLVAAIGLAITFGLMGVINMAHGELIVVGAYTTYIVQNLFGTGMQLSPFGFTIRLPGLGAEGNLYQLYFAAALPLSFLVAALVGIALERSVIRFLYKRPLESLLATWGVSLVLQQLFRLTFGANNVQVDSPAWLSGNWTVNDVLFGWNRVFVIAFAALIILLTWAALNKTPLGLLIRAVMQNREMAACMGVKTEKVNMLTFGFGSGLAGLAGAFLSQIGNVGPGLGQDYIVDAFMTVVVGGVGNIFGTVISALGIGMLNQSLQQILGNPVLGKILVLGAIILFLQWRPAGIFVTRSRSLES